MAVSISISIAQNSQSTANNTSNVTVSVTAKWTYGSNNRTGQCTGSITIDGEKYDFSGMSFNTGQTTSGSQVIMSKTVNVDHASDGSKTLNCSASFVTGVSSGTVTASASKKLTTIPRASTPTVSNTSVDMGATVVISTNRASTSFTHDLAYSFAGEPYVSIATGILETYRWTTPDLASKIPNTTSGMVSIRCITKNAGTTVGTKIINMTLKVPASVVPTISSVKTEEANSGMAAQFGAFVKGKSRVKATITAAGAKGSTIKSYSTVFEGRTYTGSSWTVAVNSSGSVNLVTTVTDSRGRTAKNTTTIQVLDYSPPAINAMQVYRVNAEGGADQDGIYIAVRYKYSVAPLNNKNTASLVIEYKRSTETEWATLLTGSALSGDTTALPTSPTFSTDYQHDVRITVTDWFGEKDTYTARLQSGAVIMDIRADGLGLGLFKTAEREGVDFGASAKGAVLGLWEATAEIPENGDFNSFLLPGVYAVPRNDTMETLSNRPCDRGGTLRVSAGIGTKKIAGAYAYIVQEFHSYHNQEPIYRRHLISDASGAFEPGPWRAITFQEQKVLWSGQYYMTAGHTIDLDEPVSKQNNGIVLVFSTYQNGAAVDSNFSFHFVPKKFIEIKGGYGCTFPLFQSSFANAGFKYLYIHDSKIVGHENNGGTGTGASGITFNNNMFVLRYVLGV